MGATLPPPRQAQEAVPVSLRRAVGPGRSDSYGFTTIAVVGDALAKSTPFVAWA
jgi:hypothetical protein